MTSWAPICPRDEDAAVGGQQFPALHFVGAGRVSAHRLCSFSLQPDNGWSGPDRQGADRDAGVREHLAQVPGRAFRTHALEPASWWTPPGTFARNSSTLYLKHHDREGRDGFSGDGTRRKKPVAEPGKNRRISRSCSRDGRRRGIDRRAATNAKLGGRIF